MTSNKAPWNASWGRSGGAGGWSPWTANLFVSIRMSCNWQYWMMCKCTVHLSENKWTVKCSELFKISLAAWLVIQSKRIQMMQQAWRDAILLAHVVLRLCRRSTVLISLWTTPLQDASWIAVATYSSSAKKRGKHRQTSCKACLLTKQTLLLIIQQLYSNCFGREMCFAVSILSLTFHNAAHSDDHQNQPFYSTRSFLPMPPTPSDEFDNGEAGKGVERASCAFPWYKVAS